MVSSDKTYLVFVNIFFVVSFVLLEVAKAHAEELRAKAHRRDCGISEKIINFVDNNFKDFLDHMSIVSFDLNDKRVHRTSHQIFKLKEKKELNLHRNYIYMSVAYLGGHTNITQSAKKFP